MNRLALRRAAGLCLIVIVLSGSTTAEADSYVVTVPSTKSDTVHVSGEITLGTDVIGMYITSSPQLEDGQAELVRNLEITDENGPVLDTSYLGEGDWSVAGSTAGKTVMIDYDIELSHGDYGWGPGIDEVAYRQSDGLFFTGFSLFIVGDGRSEAPYTVRFELPDGWRTSTAWDRIDDETYRTTDMMDLLRNCMFMGEHREETVALGDFEIVLAVGGELKPQTPLFVATMKPLLPAFRKTFGGMPRASRYLVVINPGNRSDGGAFLGSYSMLIKGEADLVTRVVWGHGIAHELLHFWNGITLSPASRQDEEWFKEGFTDYLTIVHLSRAGLDSRENTFRKLENAARRYVVARRLMGQTDSLRAAGADKHRKRGLVYAGGTLTAFSLDVRIRKATDNAKGLEDFMRAMYGEFGVTQKGFSFDDIIRVASAVSGEDQSEFFRSFVEGTDFLDVGPYFETIGLRLTTMMDEFYLSEEVSASPRARAMEESILGSNKPVD